MGIKICKQLSHFTLPNLTKFSFDVSKFNGLLACPSAFRYSCLFRNDSTTNVCWPKIHSLLISGITCQI